MGRIRDGFRAPSRVVSRMEGFVRAIVAGGCVLVAGLWLVRLFPRWSPEWGLGVTLALGGIAALGWGIWKPLTD